MTILIIEDDQKIREELEKLLENNNYFTKVLKDFTDFKKIEELLVDCDLILLDINLPNNNGFDICKKIKAKYKIPIIFVTSRDSDEDELKSILSGGDDYVTKPYNKLVLLEKIKRSLNNLNPINYREITIKNVTLDLHLSILRHNEKEVELTRNEFRIIYYFFLNPNKIITKEELLEYLWNDKYYLDENILTVNINRLRKKVSEIGADEFIETVRKVGYRI